MGLSGRADVDEELDETIPYEIEEMTAGSSEYVTADESPKEEASTTSNRRYPARIRNKKSILTYGPDFQQKSTKTTKK